MPFYEEYKVIEYYLEMNQLKAGYLYEIKARNASYGIWLPQRKSFVISRVKFGDNFLFEENHYDSEAFATAKPIKEIEKSPFDADDIDITELKGRHGDYMGYPNEDEILEYLNKFKNNKV